MADAATASAAPVPATAPAPAPRSVTAVMPSRFRSADEIRNTWAAIVEEGTSVEDVQNPTFWAHNARKLRAGDLIEVRPEDQSYFALLYVREVGGQAARVVLLQHNDLSAKAGAPLEIDQFRVEWKGPHYKFSVIRTGDRMTVKHGFETREAATRWMEGHIRAMAA